MKKVGKFRLNQKRLGGEEMSVIAAFKYLKNCPLKAELNTCVVAPELRTRISGVKSKGV